MRTSAKPGGVGAREKVGRLVWLCIRGLYRLKARAPPWRAVLPREKQGESVQLSGLIHIYLTT